MALNRSNSSDLQQPTLKGLTALLLTVTAHCMLPFTHPSDCLGLVPCKKSSLSLVNCIGRVVTRPITHKTVLCDIDCNKSLMCNETSGETACLARLLPSAT